MAGSPSALRDLLALTVTLAVAWRGPAPSSAVGPALGVGGDEPPAAVTSAGRADARVLTTDEGRAAKGSPHLVAKATLSSAGSPSLRLRAGRLLDGASTAPPATVAATLTRSRAPPQG